MDTMSASWLMAAAGGLIMIIGGLWLLFKQKIYLNPTTGEQLGTEVEIHGIGRFKTASPALAFFALGFVPLIYAPYQLTDVSKLKHDLADAQARLPEKVPIRGKVTTQPPSRVDVYAAIRVDVLHRPGEFELTVPYFKEPGESYTLLYIVDSGTIVDDQHVNLRERQDGAVRVPDKKISRSKDIAVYDETAAISPRTSEYD
jgi:hypothetical protein